METQYNQNWTNSYADDVMPITQVLEIFVHYFEEHLPGRMDIKEISNGGKPLFPYVLCNSFLAQTVNPIQQNNSPASHYICIC